MRSVSKTFESSIIKNVNTSRIKVKKIKNFFFEKNKKDLINNVVIQQLRRSDVKAVYEIKNS